MSLNCSQWGWQRLAWQQPPLVCDSLNERPLWSALACQIYKCSLFTIYCKLERTGWAGRHDCPQLVLTGSLSLYDHSVNSFKTLLYTCRRRCKEIKGWEATDLKKKRADPDLEEHDGYREVSTAPAVSAWPLIHPPLSGWENCDLPEQSGMCVQEGKKEHELPGRWSINQSQEACAAAQIWAERMFFSLLPLLLYLPLCCFLHPAACLDCGSRSCKCATFITHLTGRWVMKLLERKNSPRVEVRLDEKIIMKMAGRRKSHCRTILFLVG